MGLLEVLVIGVLSLLLALAIHPSAYPLIAALLWFALWRYSR